MDGISVMEYADNEMTEQIMAIGNTIRHFWLNEE